MERMVLIVAEMGEFLVEALGEVEKPGFFRDFGLQSSIVEKTRFLFWDC